MWHLEVGKPIRCKLTNFSFSNGHTMFKYNSCGDILAKGRMWGRERYCLGHRRMFQKHFVDFTWGDFFPSTIDDFLEAAGDEKIALRIHVPLVAGAEPTVSKTAFVDRWVALVPKGNIGTADYDLVGFARR